MGGRYCRVVIPGGHGVSESKIYGGVDCIVVGGCANGMLLKNVKSDAQFIELERPKYIKPLAHSLQAMPEVEVEKDTYEVHIIGLRNSQEKTTRLFALAVPPKETLSWGFSQLVIGFVENFTNQMLAEGRIAKH